MGISQGIGMGLLGLLIGGLAFIFAIGGSETTQGCGMLTCLVAPCGMAGIGFLLPSSTQPQQVVYVQDMYRR